MGFFGKKKSPMAQDATGGHYVAPDLEKERINSNGEFEPAQGQAAVSQRSPSLNTSFVTDIGTFRQFPEQKMAPPEQNAVYANRVSPSVAHAATRPPFETSGHAENAPPAGQTVDNHILLNNLSAAEEGRSLERSMSGGEITDPSLLGIQTVASADTQESKDTAFTITRNGQYLTLNGFANGHLMRWKFAAEEGPAIIRIPAIFCAMAVIVSTLMPIVTDPDYWSIPPLITAFHTCVACFLIFILELRVLGIRNPDTQRARIRLIITRYAAVLKLLWGRGLLYIYAGSMNMTVEYSYVTYTGIPMIILGLVAMAAGLHASMNLDQLKSSLTDESYLWEKFKRCDGDQDDSLDLEGFAELLWSLGLEFDDMYTHRAFYQIGREKEKLVSFDEFKKWWIVTQNDGKRLRGGYGKD